MSAAPSWEPTRLVRVPPRFAETRWRPIARIGEGGMGTVWEVEHTQLGRRAALKVLHERHRGRPDLAGRLLDEARALARLRHPGVPGVLDLGELDDGRPYFVMDLVSGRNLRAEVARHGVVAVPTAVRWMAELLGVLEAVHGAALVHRDVKLDNVLLDDQGHVVLVDFGVALAVDATLRRTARGRVVGTPRTMSPEQHALADVDLRADLYAVGLCLFELIAGRGPFADVERSATGIFHAHCRRPPPRLGDVAPQLVPRALEDVVARALAKSPADRFDVAGSMREALLAAVLASLPSQRMRPVGYVATQESPLPALPAGSSPLLVPSDSDAEGPDEASEDPSPPESSATWVLSSGDLRDLGVSSAL